MGFFFPDPFQVIAPEHIETDHDGMVPHSQITVHNYPDICFLMLHNMAFLNILIWPCSTILMCVDTSIELSVKNLLDMGVLPKIFLKIHCLKSNVCSVWLVGSKGVISKSIFLTASMYIMEIFLPHQIGV